MGHILPMFSDPLRAVSLVNETPRLRPFSVTLQFDGQKHDLHVLAFKSCDAICTALDLFFDGECEMPDGMKISAHPANILRVA